MVYQLFIDEYRGDSSVDAIPSAVGRAGYYRLDTNTGLRFRSDGTNWIDEPVFLDFRRSPLMTLLRQNRYGCYCPSEEARAVGYGRLGGITGVGTKSDNGNTADKYDIWSTRAVADDCAGVIKLDTWTCRRNGNPLLRYAWLFPGTSTGRRMYKGVGAKRLINVDSDTRPLNDNESGIFFGFGAGDSVFSIYNNDGTDVCVKTPTTVTIPGIATNYILEIQLQNSGTPCIWTLYSVISSGIIGTGVRGNIITNGTGTINSRVPSSTANLYLQDLVATTNTTIQANNIHYCEVYT